MSRLGSRIEALSSRPAQALGLCVAVRASPRAICGVNYVLGDGRLSWRVRKARGNQRLGNRLGARKGRKRERPIRRIAGRGLGRRRGWLLRRRLRLNDCVSVFGFSHYM